jgi:uncharacterized membrane protein
VNSNLSKKVTLAISLGLTMWIVGIVVTPLLAASEGLFGQKIASFAYFFYQPVCHQIHERSLLLEGYMFAVCVRCFSFYLGGLLTTVIYLFKDKIQMLKISRYILLVAPAVLDFGLEKFNLYPNIFVLRFLTGLLLGFAIFHLLFVSLSTNQAKQETLNT